MCGNQMSWEGSKARIENGSIKFCYSIKIKRLNLQALGTQRRPESFCLYKAMLTSFLSCQPHLQSLSEVKRVVASS
jgi:hypothetical protein